MSTFDKRSGGDEREIEAVAVAIYESRIHSAIINGWTSEPEALRERFRKAARAALARVRGVRDDNEGEKTSDAVRERPIRHLSVNGPDDRQPNGPSTVAGRGAVSAGGHSSDQMIAAARAVADFAYRQGVGDAVAVDHLITEVERLYQRCATLEEEVTENARHAREAFADADQARIDLACIGEMVDKAEAEVKRLTAIVDAQTGADR